jgi:aryl-alcohol dehydrogenase-like predicted oxidoreductase
MTQKKNPDIYVPKRAFGNIGVKISKLCLGGGSFGSTDSEALLDEALKYGVDCWEIVSFTGKVYSEYFKKHPGIREKVFCRGKYIQQIQVSCRNIWKKCSMKMGLPL